MNRTEADAIVQQCRAALPDDWSVDAKNTEIRPGHPERFKVVCLSGSGIAITCDPEKRFRGTIDDGPGMADEVFSRGHGDRTFGSASEVFAAVRRRVRSRFGRLSRQILSV